MRNSIAVLILTCCFLQLQAQQAIFRTDTKYLYSNHSKEDSLSKQERYKDTEWRIHGQKLTWFSGKVVFVPDPLVMDTIFFHQSAKHDWDTLLCNVKYPGEYTFVFNECCGGFYLVNKKFKWVTEPVVDFWVKAEGNYFCSVNAEGAALKPGIISRVDNIPRGAMDPNVVRVKLEKGTPCQSQADSCAGSIHLQEGEKEDEYLISWYEPQEVICSFLYIDLNGEPLKVMYGVRKKLEIR